MNQKILIIYRSVTGFTERYARWISEELGCEAMELKKASGKTMVGYHTIIFGGRFHAGLVDGLKQGKKLFAESGAERLIVFATGATPGTETNMIDEAWKNNFTPEELTEIPHFYMESGLRQKNMPLGDKLMLRLFAAMMKKKKEKSEYETAMANALGSSFDHSSRAYIEPLIACVRGGQDEKWEKTIDTETER